jgi:hypothetical protein
MNDRRILEQILANTETIMATTTALQAADTALKTEVLQVITDWQAALTASAGDQAAVDAVTADMTATLAQLKASDPALPPVTANPVAPVVP